MSPSGPQGPEYPGDPTQPTEPLRGPVPPRQPIPPRQPVRPVAPPAVERVPPALPPEDPWWGGNPWGATVACIVVLLLGGVVGYLIGQSNGSSEKAARTITSTSTVTRPKVVVHTDTVTSRTVTQVPANPASEQRRVEAEAEVKKLEKENEELRSSEAG